MFFHCVCRRLSHLIHRGFMFGIFRLEECGTEPRFTRYCITPFLKIFCDVFWITSHLLSMPVCMELMCSHGCRHRCGHDLVFVGFDSLADSREERIPFGCYDDLGTGTGTLSPSGATLSG